MDMISKLPDEVLQHILSFLPTKNAVATSILSTRWIRLWDSLKVLDFNNSLYLIPEREIRDNGNLFLEFVDKVLCANKSPIIFKFTLRICELSLSRINRWIQNVVLRNVVEIDLRVFSSYQYYEQCLRIPGCSALEILKVDSAHPLYMPTSGCCFPNLRVLDVEMPMDGTDHELTRKLVPSLPRLEELSLCLKLAHCHREIYIEVTGTALKVFNLKLLDKTSEFFDVVVKIDAPNLQVLRIKEKFLSFYRVKNKPRLNEIRIDIGSYIKVASDSHVERLSELLQGIENAESLSISATTSLTLAFARKTKLPVFHYLTKLELIVYPCIWVLLLHWLQSSPNLKHLFLRIEERKDYYHLQKDVDWCLSETVPPCLSWSITEIEIKTFGNVEEGELLMYLLDNAKVLGKFIVDSRVYIKDGVLQ